MKTLKRTLSAVLVAAIALAPALTASAIDIAPINAPLVTQNPVPEMYTAPTFETYAAPARLPDNVLVCGMIENAGDGTLLIADETIGEIIVHVGEQTRILDAVTGEPVLDALEAGSFVYVYINSFMTMSLPPQAGAQLILCNAPQDFKAPSYHTVLTAELNEDGTELTFTTDKGDEFTFDESVALTPYMTRNMVYLQNIIPGTRLLVWEEAQSMDEPSTISMPTKAMLFAYEYDGYFEIIDGYFVCNGEELDLGLAPIIFDENRATALPLRAVCEALGWTVDWDADLRAAAISKGDRAFVVLPGKAIAGLGEHEVALTIVPEIIGGFTMVCARDMAHLLNMFCAGN